MNLTIMSLKGWPHFLNSNYRIRPIKRTLLDKRTPPIFFADFGGPASAKDRLLMLNFSQEVTQTKSHTFSLAL